ncbi:MAG: hypothetical protein EPN22_06825 [Nitrospirae bacterium]|nr:MAG: hypothetical protein EPN22_06825 [Nitrospirota bacterium]
MKNKPRNKEPLLYHKTKEEIQSYMEKPVKEKFEWLETQMEFFYKTMPPKAKRLRDSLKKEDL